MHPNRPQSPHLPGAPLFVTNDTRKCVACPDDANVHGLVEFAKRTVAWETFYSDVCRECHHKENVERKLKVEQRMEANDRGLVRKLSKTRKGVPFSELIEAVARRAGGTERLFTKFGAAYDRILDKADSDEAEKEDKELAVKIGGQLLSSAAAVERTKQPVDLSELSEEDLIDILMEPARRLIMKNAKFRKELFNDLEIRKAILSTGGIEVIDSDGESLE